MKSHNKENTTQEKKKTSSKHTSRRESCLTNEISHSQRSERRLLSRFHNLHQVSAFKTSKKIPNSFTHDGATGSNGRSNLPGEHEQRKVPFETR